MREVVFLRKNEKKWRSIEQLLGGGETADPDTLADLYIELTDDLAYSQTNYPGSKTTLYLNGLTADIFQALYKRKKGNSRRIITFWTEELPYEFYKIRRQFTYSLAFFAVAVLIGVASTHYDEDFVRTILGDSYVNMTLDNIEKGDPMAVYKDDGKTLMFLGITINNIKVSFIAFACGIFLSLGTYLILFQNGVMLGAFQYFFYQKGVLLTSFLTIWIHGTIEISAIVIAGGAGIVMGNSFLFPGTYKRIHSLTRGAKKGIKVIVGLVPLFIIAGFLESFVTRHTEWPNAIRLGIILTSLAFVLFYFAIYPRILYKKMLAQGDIME